MVTLPAATRRCLPAAVGAAAVAVAGLVLVVDPNEPGSLGMCPFRFATGLDCPGCGTLRAVRALLLGDPVRALDHNVLTVLLLPLLIAVWWTWLRTAQGRRSGVLVPPRWLGPAMAVVVPAFWVARNLPWFGQLAATAA